MKVPCCTICSLKRCFSLYEPRAQEIFFAIHHIHICHMWFSRIGASIWTEVQAKGTAGIMQHRAVWRGHVRTTNRNQSEDTTSQAASAHPPPFGKPLAHANVEEPPQADYTLCIYSRVVGWGMCLDKSTSRAKFNFKEKYCSLAKGDTKAFRDQRSTV